MARAYPDANPLDQTLKLALLFRSCGPYHLARLRAARQRHSIVALEYCDVDADYGWNVQEEKRACGVVTLSNDARSLLSVRARYVAALKRQLRECAPDAIAIPGYSEGFALAALIVSRRYRIPAILMSDTHGGTARDHRLRHAVKKAILPLFASALVAGTLQERYLATLGMPPENISTGFDVVDNGHFSAPPPQERIDSKIRELGIRSPFFFCCARFVEKKNLRCLIDAYVQYRCSDAGGGWDLVVAGDGPLRSELMRYVSETQYSASIHLIGHQSYDELPPLYQAASAFVLPSMTDEWGLVVNEAMAAGVPVLVSRGAGCWPDLVGNGSNGFTFDPTDTSALAELMLSMTQSESREAMGQESQRIIRNWDLDRFAAGLSDAAIAACRSPRRTQPNPLGLAVATALSHRV